MARIGLRPLRDGDNISEQTPLFVFIDESGNFDFSSGGTSHFLMAAVIARDPIASACALQAVKYDLMSDGIDEPFFHASEDKQAIRDRVFAVLNELPSVSTHVIYADKHYAAPALQNTVRMYSLFGGAIAKYLLMTLSTEQFSQVIIVFDKALPKRDENAFLAQVKPALNKLGRPYRLYFQSVKFDFNGQIADYFAWANYIALERGDRRALASIPKARMTKFDLFRTGHTKYY